MTMGRGRGRKGERQPHPEGFNTFLSPSTFSFRSSSLFSLYASGKKSLQAGFFSQTARL